LKQNNVVTVTVNQNESLEEAYDRMKDEAIMQLQEDRKSDGLSGVSSANFETRYRVDILEHAYSANMSMGQLNKFKPALDAKGTSSLSIGDANDLPRTVGAALRNAQKMKIKWIMADCHPLFCTISDGSPLGCNAEALMVRMVRASNHEIIDLLISLSMFESSLSGENIASHILSALAGNDLDPEHWRGGMADRASSNKKAHSEISRLTMYNPMEFPCMAHTFCLPGKEFSKACSLLNNFRKAYNSSIKFRGKLYQYMKKLFMVTPKVAGGVRWYLEWEQIAQMDSMGVEQIAKEVVSKAVEWKLCPQSREKMRKWSTDELMPRLKVEIGAVAEVGRQFCIATYAAEGNDPLPFAIHRTFDDLDRYVGRGATFAAESNTVKRCKEAAAMVKPKWQTLKDAIVDAGELVRSIEEDELPILEQDLAMFDEMVREEEDRLQLENEERHRQQKVLEMEHGRPMRQRRPNVRNQPLPHEVAAAETNEGGSPADGPADEEAQPDDTADSDQRLEKVAAIAAKQEELKLAKSSLTDAKAALANFEAAHDNVLTEEDFISYAKKCVQPAFDKYTSLFTEDAALARAKKAFCACKLFDVLYLRSGPSIESLNRLIDDLVHFDFPEFDDNFREKLKKEVPELLALATALEHNLEGEDAVAETKRFHERVKERERKDRQRATLFNVDAHLRQQEEEGSNDEAEDGDGYVGVEEAVRDAMLAEDNDNSNNNFRYSDWKHDVGERARRIYDWWRVVMNEKRGVSKFQEAVRIIATTQVSSAAVERVFSQLTFIRRAIGDLATREVLETRAYVRCNNDMGGDFTVKY
jgi:hypothetical protein